MKWKKKEGDTENRVTYYKRFPQLTRFSYPLSQKNVNFCAFNKTGNYSRVSLVINKNGEWKLENTQDTLYKRDKKAYFTGYWKT